MDLENLAEGGFAPEIESNLCFVGKFLTHEPINIASKEQNLAAVWRPGMQILIKELEQSLFLFRFFHALDMERILAKGPSAFEQHILVTARLERGVIPLASNIHFAEFWVQVYDIPCGFMSELVGKEIGKFLSTYIETDANNFSGSWRSYMRIRVRIDVNEPLKRRMHMKKPGGTWVWINFKYERLPIFCFYCGVMGHSDQFCYSIYKSGVSVDVVNTYGLFMKAPN